MTQLEILGLGFGLGVRHALDADHLVAVSTLVSQERSHWRATRVAALWGTGHTTTFLAVGLVLAWTEVRLPGHFATWAESAVGVMLIAMGIWQLRGVLLSGTREPIPPILGDLQPLLVGLVHGLAGSTGIALLYAASLPTPLLAAGHLALNALGTLAGMVSLTALLTRPLMWARGRSDSALFVLRGLTALLSVLLGLWILGTPLT